jgi:RNA polymerase sigma factor (TIGR02999 family)
MIEGTPSGRDITRVLAAAASGEPNATEELLPLVYEELRRVAAAQLARERPGHTLQATALVHEAYLRLIGDDAASWDNRRHFFAAASEAMRRILVERARRQRRVRHGGGHRRVEFDADEIPVEVPSVDLMALDDAIDRLAAEDPQKAELVKLRFFAGLSEQEAADVLGISRATAARHWAYARAWLFDCLRDDDAKNGINPRS